MVVRPYGNSLEVRAPAKLNLHLEVLARRSDGFHEIETLMVPFSLYDTISFRASTDPKINVHCSWAVGLATRFQNCLGDLPSSQSNIVTKALELLRAEAGVHNGAEVAVLKRIPSQAGMGGASSDAAAVLLAANQGWHLGWSLERLSELASRLGSDIPFFLRPEAAICRGRGELIETVGILPPLWIVVVRPAEGLSTPAVYNACQPADTPVNASAITAGARQGKPLEVARRLMNRLQEPAEQLSPAIVRLRQEFARTDCLGHQMSGSGSSYFGLCHSAAHARRVAARLEARSLGFIAWGRAGVA